MITYRVWEDKVNTLMLNKHGVGIDDIPDMPYHDWYTDHITPEKVVKMAIDIVNEGGF